MTIRGAISALNRLNGPDAIRDFLVERKITGKQSQSCYCPVANYIRGFTAVPICVGRWSIIVGDTQLASLRYTDPLSVFIGKFDLGHYPELIA